MVLLGESVARGYLFDPCADAGGGSGAMLNEAMPRPRLRSRRPGAHRPHLSRAGRLLLATPALEPDALVLFAGNNWENVTFSLRTSPAGAAVREGGFPACTARLHWTSPAARLPARCSTPRRHRPTLGMLVVVMFRSSTCATGATIPPCWRPSLAGEDNVAWLAAGAARTDAMGRGTTRRRRRAAGDMIDLDDGTSSPPGAAGRSPDPLGRPAEARARLEAARDAVFGSARACSAPLPGRIQNVQRAKAAEHHFALVDLPRSSQRAQNGDLPDRRLFLDYCHLTRVGIHLAMGDVAAACAARPLPPLPGRRSRPSSGRRSGRPLPGRDPQRALRSRRGDPPPSLRASAGALRPPCGRHACVRRFPSRPGREVDERVVRCPVRASRDRPVPVRLGSTPHGEAGRFHADRGHGLLPRGGGRARARLGRAQRWRSRTDRERSTCCGRPGARRLSASAAPTPWAGSAPTCRPSRPRACSS